MAMRISSRRHFRARAHHGSARLRAGLSVIEIMVALTLFGTVTIAMGGLSLVVARRAETNDVFTKRTAVLQQQMSWLQAIPYDSLDAKEGSYEVADGPFPHTRKITLVTTGNHTRVYVQVTPTNDPEAVESIAFDRAKPTNSPLCKGCAP
jgi:Tfp pilus assembly protein PilV